MEKKPTKTDIKEQVAKEVSTPQENKDEKPIEIRKMEARNRTGILLDKLKTEMQNGHRDIDAPIVGKVRIKLATVAIDEEISKFKSRLTTELLSDDRFILRDQILNELCKRCVWDDKKEALEQDLIADIADYTRQIMYIRHADDIDYKRLESLQSERAALEHRRAKLVRTRDQFFQGSIETQVETGVFKLQLVKCIYLLDEEDNEKELLWKDIEELENDTRKSMVNYVTTQAGYFWNGWSEDLLNDALGEA